ncbi:hypothetical protein HERIO_2016 [Hepatospora eriocheir]|uniref:Uncharacterized protein n=1 Tax=Hepatospora eriocheir TaxID=1081669 RepID=A0A1X0Q8C5_9MICR|nr:hypothetical protein HERIO_2016 [Hepatospora eriocheir]
MGMIGCITSLLFCNRNKSIKENNDKIFNNKKENISFKIKENPIRASNLDSITSNIKDSKFKIVKKKTRKIKKYKNLYSNTVSMFIAGLHLNIE